MINKFRILVLTDHSGHSDQNSLYAIVRQMLVHPKCEYIDVASRGLSENEPFYDEMLAGSLYGSRATAEFKFSKNGHHHSAGLKKLNPLDYDIVFMRLPRPLSDAFLNWTEELFSQAILINEPHGIIATSNKKYLLNFPNFCPNVRLCISIEEIEEEVAKYPIVLKPLREYGGKGLLKITGQTLDDGTQKHDAKPYLEAMRDEISEGFLSMRYLKNVSQGDKRILVVGGEILAASVRLPAEGSWLCNVAQGGTSVAADVTSDEIEIINAINPKLAEHGILMYGADTLVDDDGKRVLSEINTLSIGGFPQAELQTGRPIIKTLIDKIFEYAHEKTN